MWFTEKIFGFYIERYFLILYNDNNFSRYIETQEVHHYLERISYVFLNIGCDKINCINEYVPPFIYRNTGNSSLL